MPANETQTPRLKAKHISPGWFKFFINIWPPLLGTGIKVTSISPDYRSIEVRMSLHWFNRNYVGSHFGGSIFSMTDPFYMLMLLQNLGPDYIVWDKAAKIDFKKVARGTIYANFKFSAEEIADIKQQADTHDKYVFDRTVDITNEEGAVVARVERTLYVRKKTR